MLYKYNIDTESQRENYVVDASTEVSLTAHSIMVKEGLDHLPVVLFTKDNMYAYKPVPMVNLPPVRFIGGPTKQGKYSTFR